MMKFIKIIIQILLVLMFSHNGFACGKKLINSSKIAPGTYIAVSLGMPENSLKNYFAECLKIQEKGHVAKLVIQGLPDDVGGNRFMKLKDKIEELEINLDINPVLFKELDINKVPMIIIVDKEGKFKKISGHIPLKTALEIMEKEPS